MEHKHANVLTGQFMTAPPDETSFRGQAEEYGFDVADYLAALREVLVVAAGKLAAIHGMLVRMTNLITNLSIDRQRANESQARQSIILNTILSVLDLPDQKIKAFREGAVDYITKPFQSEEVVARVQTHLQLTNVVALKREIAERKLAEKALKDSDLFVRNILSSVAEGFMVVDRDYRILLANRAYCEQAQLPPD